MTEGAAHLPEARVFAIAAGEDFARTFAEGFLQRYGARPPEEIARITVVLNSAYTLAAVRHALMADGKARLLPRLRLVSSYGLDDERSVWTRGLERQLRIASALHPMSGRIRGLEGDVGVLRLAAGLSGLMRDMASADLPPDMLEKVEVDARHAAHWTRNLELFRAAATYIADPDNDPERRQWAALRALGEAWNDSPPPDPVIIAGSTGSVASTAFLMRLAIAIPSGAVVLPAFDPWLPKSVWHQLMRGSPETDVHPQQNIARFLASAGIAPDAVSPWTRSGTEAARERQRIVSLAMRPAPDPASQVADSDAETADRSGLDGLGLIEAPDRRTEALAIALCLRAAVEEGSTAALVTPDRQLVRRVAACLDRWGIVPDDRAGTPLGQTPVGRFLRLVARLVARRTTAPLLISVLKHPLACSGGEDRTGHLRIARKLEKSLRQTGPAFPDGGSLRDWGIADGDPETVAWSGWLAGILDDLGLPGKPALRERLAHHLGLAERIAAGPDPQTPSDALWSGRDGEAVQRALRAFDSVAAVGPEVSAEGFTDLLDEILSSQNLPPGPGARQGVIVIGPREARSLSADLVILGGLIEGVWPPKASPGPILSRAMLRQIGLPSPDAETGLLAQDFQHLVSMPNVVLSCATRDESAPSVASRWLMRLRSVAGGQSDEASPEWQAVRERGAHWVRLARMIDAPPDYPRPASRPAPSPPLSARPRRFSVTQVRTLVTDPYAIYASEILRLRPIPPVRRSDDPMLRGIVFHEILHRFVDQQWTAAPHEEQVARFLGIAEDLLNRHVPWPTDRRLWLARLRRIADDFVRSEEARQSGAKTVFGERKGQMDIGNGLVLTARPDRIDIVGGRALRVIDYKTGRLPKDDEIGATEFQVPLEAAMASAGCFPGVPALPVESGQYLQIGGEGEVLEVDLERHDPARVLERVRQHLASYSEDGRAYAARRDPGRGGWASDYDGISRYGEWDLGDRAVIERVGQ